MPSTDLPDFTQAGQPGTWTITDRHGSEILLEGDFLGIGSSHRPYHKHPFPPHAEPGQHCSTCRWMEVRIFQEDGPLGRYLVVKSGRSIVPGEEDIVNSGWADSAAEVVSALTDWDDQQRPVLTFIAKRALEQASRYDDPVYQAYRAFTERLEP